MSDIKRGIKVMRGGCEGAVVFLGSMNAMPMMYALELRQQGVNVLYFVDAPKRDTLSRPECHFPEIKYPYPDWIIELNLKSQILLPLAPRLFASWLIALVRKHSGVRPQAFVLNGFFISLAPYLTKGVPCTALAHGSDIHTWADLDQAAKLAKSFARRSVFRMMPSILSRSLIKRVVLTQFTGASKCENILYFPPGFSVRGDCVIKRLAAARVRYIPRYDMSFKPLYAQPRGLIDSHQAFTIFSGVRFLFATFPDGNRGQNKGNDIMIKGIGMFRAENPQQSIRVHFVQKGGDVDAAKALCAQHGISDIVTWYKEMPFRKLLKLYQTADVCFDQVGDHWIAGIGFYALWLGRPLIANDGRATASGVWPADNPVLTAATATDVCAQLNKMLMRENRVKAAARGMAFAEQYLGPSRALKDAFEVAD